MDICITQTIGKNTKSTASFEIKKTASAATIASKLTDQLFCTWTPIKKALKGVKDEKMIKLIKKRAAFKANRTVKVQIDGKYVDSVFNATFGTAQKLIYRPDKKDLFRLELQLLIDQVLEWEKNKEKN